MNKKLSKEAIDEVVGLLKEVKEVVSLLNEMGIQITSDPWQATSFDGSENILVWERKDFEKINEDISDGDTFYIGGNVITGGQHQYKDKWINAPKELAEVEGKIFEKYLQSIVNSTSLKYFNLKLKNPYGLTDNCGWENYFVIETTVKDSALINSPTEKLLQQILNEKDCIIELSASPIYTKPKNEFSKKSGLQPQGDFLYMVEFFSNLVIDENTIYQGAFGLNSKYIKDAMKLINQVEKRAKELANKYADKGVKVTVNGLNDGCEKGMAVYVWIPYQ